jgi:hypothetical protein
MNYPNVHVNPINFDLYYDVSQVFKIKEKCKQMSLWVIHGQTAACRLLFWPQGLV